MRSVARLGGALGVGLLLLAGCGQPKSERLVKTRIDLLNAHAAEFETIAANLSSADPEETKKRLTKIEGQIEENRLALEAAPKPEVMAAEAKFDKELSQALDRDRDAHKAILKAVFKKKFSK